jgi:parallel beta-helix repeat protein
MVGVLQSRAVMLIAMRRFHVLSASVLVVGAIAPTAGCSSSSGGSGTDGGADVQTADADAGGAPDADAATSDGPDACGPVNTMPSCTVHVQPSSGDPTSTVQTALTAAQANDVICFDDGTYAFTDKLEIHTRNLTLRGTGTGAVLDFAGEPADALAGVHATSDGFTIERLTVKNTTGDAVRVDGPATGITFRGLTISWDLPQTPEAGAPVDAGGDASSDAVAGDGGPSPAPRARYGIYPITCTDVLIENNEVSGATDSGIYVGQSTNAIVRNNVVHANPGGIEIENTTHADVYGNHAYDNAAGLMVLNDPNLPIENGLYSNVHDNLLEANNHANFGVGIVAGVPVGIGMLIVAASDTEVHSNTMVNNDSTGTLIVSCTLFNNFMACPTTNGYYPWAETDYVHDNTYGGNGSSPDPQFAILGAPLPDIVWDGDVNPALPHGATAGMCVTNNVDDMGADASAPATFLDFNYPSFTQSTDLGPFQCMNPAQPAVSGGCL